jgi:hypothetical protein
MFEIRPESSSHKHRFFLVEKLARVNMENFENIRGINIPYTKISAGIQIAVLKFEFSRQNAVIFPPSAREGGINKTSSTLDQVGELSPPPSH